MAVTLGKTNMAKTTKKTVTSNKKLDNGVCEPAPAMEGIDGAPGTNNSGVSSLMGKKYEQSYSKLYDALPNWKKQAVNDSRIAKRSDDSLYNDFIKSVIENAEKQ